MLNCLVKVTMFHNDTCHVNFIIEEVLLLILKLHGLLRLFATTPPSAFLWKVFVTIDRNGTTLSRIVLAMLLSVEARTQVTFDIGSRKPRD